MNSRYQIQQSTKFNPNKMDQTYLLKFRLPKISQFKLIQTSIQLILKVLLGIKVLQSFFLQHIVVNL